MKSELRFMIFLSSEVTRYRVTSKKSPVFFGVSQRFLSTDGILQMAYNLGGAIEERDKEGKAQSARRRKEGRAQAHSQAERKRTARPSTTTSVQAQDQTTSQGPYACLCYRY